MIQSRIFFMNPLIYKESAPDYYAKTFSLSDYKHQVRCLTSRGSTFLCVDDRSGFKVVGWLDKIWQTVRGIFGFIDRTDRVLVKSEALKLLHYGKTKGYLQDDDVRSLLQKGLKGEDHRSTRLGKTVSKVIRSVLENGSVGAATSDLPTTLVDFHVKHSRHLNAGFGQHLLAAPEVPQLSDPQFFGATYLHLAKQTAQQHTPKTPLRSVIDSVHAYFTPPPSSEKRRRNARNAALEYYQRAQALGNVDKMFQKRFRDQFEIFVSHYFNIPPSEGWMESAQRAAGWNSPAGISSQDDTELHHVLELMRSLISIAYSQGDLHEVERFALFGLKYFPQDVQLISFKCLAQVKQNNYQQAPNHVHAMNKRAQQLDSVLKIESDPVVLKAVGIELKEIYLCIADIYDHLKDDVVNASVFLQKAWDLDTSDKSLEVRLFHALMVAAEKEHQKDQGVMGMLKSRFSKPQQNGLEYIHEASKFISAVKIEDLQRLISSFEKHAKYDKAIQFYEFGIQKWPEHKLKFTLSPQTYYEYGLMQRNNQKSVEAYHVFQKAHQLDPKNKRYIHELLKLSLLLAEENIQANRRGVGYHYLKDALKQNPSPAERQKIQKLLKAMATQCLSEAQDHLQKCLLPDGLADSLLFEERKQHKQACVESLGLTLKSYNEALLYDPTDACIHFDKASLLDFFDMHEESMLEAYECAVRYNPENYFYLMRLGEVLKEQHKEERGDHYQHLAMKKHPNHTFDYLHWFDDRFLANKTYAIDPHTFLS